MWLEASQPRRFTPPPGRQGGGNADDPEAAKELRILLIEDSILLVDRLTEMLTERGVMRVAADVATEREARQAIDESTFDVLLVDVELREGSGIGAISHARNHYGENQPLIIVLTNYPLPAVRQHCLAAGADHFLDKMSQFRDVKELITRSVRSAPN